MLYDNDIKSCGDEEITESTLDDLRQRPYLKTTLTKISDRTHELPKAKIHKYIKIPVIPENITKNYMMLLESGNSIRLSPLNGDSLYYCIIDQLKKHNVYPMNDIVEGEALEMTGNRYPLKKSHIKGSIGNITIDEVVYTKAMVQLRNDISTLYNDNRTNVISYEDEDGSELQMTFESLLQESLDINFDDYLSRLKYSSTVFKDGYRGIVGNERDLGVITVLFNINIDVLQCQDGNIEDMTLEVDDSKELYTIRNHAYNQDKQPTLIRIADLGDGYYVSLE